MTRPYVKGKNIPNTQFFSFRTNDNRRYMVAVAHTIVMVLFEGREVWRASAPFRDDVIPQVRSAEVDGGLVLCHHSTDPVVLRYPWKLETVKEKVHG